MSTRDQLAVVAHLSRWLDAERLDVTDVAEATVERFLAARRAAGYRAAGYRAHPVASRQ